MLRLFLTVWLVVLASAHAGSLLETFGSGTNQFQIEFVTIGNPGNLADTTGAPNPAGRVDYIYNLGKYEVSADMIAKANSAGGLGLTFGNSGNKPATSISWNEAARFVNWLNTSRGYQAAYNFTTNGANANIALWGAGLYSGTNQFRHKDSYYFLPSTDEWYKGAYYDPNKSGGAGYWNFPNGGDSAPTNVPAGTTGAVYGQPVSAGPADIENAGGLSPYGTMAQGGNVWEWTESALDGSNDLPTENRELRGGSWATSFGTLFVTGRGGYSPSNSYGDTGFRVVMVPEPSASALILFGGSVFASLRRRNTKSGGAMT